MRAATNPENGRHELSNALRRSRSPPFEHNLVFGPTHASLTPRFPPGKWMRPTGLSTTPSRSSTARGESERRVGEHKQGRSWGETRGGVSATLAQARATSAMYRGVIRPGPGVAGAHQHGEVGCLVAMQRSLG
ncbi:hypothetical protein CMUS01_14476 [Colletotrichum musicola]|uniref:Uncharacterized protein n=1 Tax=Colletotrichum musicola TaxID=2175873 RepID=A0A8H6MR30_9PEZI|nr:hypothetical protein CMUS01_14476 [Colletotrichum musicola]